MITYDIFEKISKNTTKRNIQITFGKSLVGHSTSSLNEKYRLDMALETEVTVITQVVL